MKIVNVLVILLLMTTAYKASAQTDKERALEQAKKAMKLEQDGDMDGAILLLEESHKLEPSNITYSYEIAYAHYHKKEYAKAKEYLEGIIKDKNVTDLVYQLLGNTYNDMGDRDKAIDICNKGLKKFPNSGKIYNEMGIMQTQQKEYSKALVYHEKGIEVDPKFPSNYYWAAKIYCSTEEEVWGMIYGELFLNLERNSNRTTEISKMLYKTYLSEAKYTSDTTMSVDFSKGVVKVTDPDPKKFKMPFGVGIYEPTFLMAMMSSRHMNLNSLDTIRSSFVDNYYKNKHDQKFPNILFDYQKKVKEAGYMSAYNHWILMNGDESQFTEWTTVNNDKWTSFVKWFKENPIKVDESHRFYRAQYE